MWINKQTNKNLAPLIYIYILFIQLSKLHIAWDKI